MPVRWSVSMTPCADLPVPQHPQVRLFLAHLDEVVAPPPTSSAASSCSPTHTISMLHNATT